MRDHFIKRVLEFHPVFFWCTIRSKMRKRSGTECVQSSGHRLPAAVLLPNNTHADSILPAASSFKVHTLVHTHDGVWCSQERPATGTCFRDCNLLWLQGHKVRCILGGWVWTLLLSSGLMDLAKFHSHLREKDQECTRPPQYEQMYVWCKVLDLALYIHAVKRHLNVPITFWMTRLSCFI